MIHLQVEAELLTDRCSSTSDRSLLTFKTKASVTHVFFVRIIKKKKKKDIICLQKRNCNFLRCANMDSACPSRSETSSVLHLLALLLPAWLPPQTHGGAHWSQGLPVLHVRQALHPEKLAQCAHAHPPCRAHLPVQRVPPGLHPPHLAGAPRPAARPPRPPGPGPRPGAWARHDLTYQAQSSGSGRALRYGWRGWHGWQHGQHAQPRSFLHLERESERRGDTGEVSEPIPRTDT